MNADLRFLLVAVLRVFYRLRILSYHFQLVWIFNFFFSSFSVQAKSGRYFLIKDRDSITSWTPEDTLGNSDVETGCYFFLEFIC